MPVHRIAVFMFAFLVWILPAQSQSFYQYTLNVATVENDRLGVELTVPKLAKESVVFSFPKIVPGTYTISDFGRFVEGLKAYDQKHRLLPVIRLNANQWEIRGASQLKTINYQVRDISGDSLANQVVSMAATIFEKGDHMVLNLPGVLGYFEGYRAQPFRLEIKKPEQWYASSGLRSSSPRADLDIFHTRNVDELYDSPIMYSKPDTTTVRLGNCQVLFSVYSPHKLFNSKVIATWMQPLLEAAKTYLGGRIPKDKFVFLYYFKDTTVRHFLPSDNSNNILEHGTSTYWYMQEKDSGTLKKFITDISIHEFFHTVTPYTVATRQLQAFDFSKPALSQHLWLYEGGAVYMSSHARVKHEQLGNQNFLNALGRRITVSRERYIDTLPFTEIGVHSADKWNAQYTNVYQKGVLIVACLDLYLLHLSGGQYGFKDLMQRMETRIKKGPMIDDNRLFEVMEEVSIPGVKQFLETYVGGGKPIPYKDYFALAGIDLEEERRTPVYSVGEITLVDNGKGLPVIKNPYAGDSIGLKMGFQAGDALYTLNGKPIHMSNWQEQTEEIRRQLKSGDRLEATVGRVINGKLETLTLATSIVPVIRVEKNVLTINPSPTLLEQRVRRAWLKDDGSTQ